jgi:hypothetical protein
MELSITDREIAFFRRLAHISLLNIVILNMPLTSGEVSAG